MTNRYDELSDRARWFLNNFDEIDLADTCAAQEASNQTREAALARVQHLADHIAAGAPWTRNHDELAQRIRDAATIGGGQTAAGAKETPTAGDSERCCVCGSSAVVYRNYREQPFCWPCADCDCNQDVCLRTGINDPATSETAATLDRVRKAAASFDGRGVITPGNVNLDIPTAGEVLDAVRTALNGKEQP
jgi:hypothetical protein